MAARLPDFLIVGAARSGTTALYQYLVQHPEVFGCEPKEPHFFALEGEEARFSGPGDAETINARAVTRLERYRELFAGAGAARAVGEASVSYLYYPRAVEGIARHLGSPRIICLLRQPAARAFSAFNFMRTRGYEPCARFADALRDEPRRIEAGWHHIWHYRRMGFYHEQLARYFAAFDRERIRVYLYDDFRHDPGALLRDCFEFLEVDPGFVPPTVPRPHRSGIPRSLALSKLLTRSYRGKELVKGLLPAALRYRLRNLLSVANVRRVEIDGESHAALMAGYEPDIRRLEELIGRDLSSWRRAAGRG